MFIDTHCHLNFHQFDADRAEVVQAAMDAGVGIIINPAVDLATSRQAIELAERYPGVYAQVGVHPNDSADFSAATLAELAELAQHPKVVAIGEIGLDYYWERVPHEQQRAAFEGQLELAARLDLPVVLHCRVTGPPTPGGSARPRLFWACCTPIPAIWPWPRRPLAGTWCSPSAGR